jgi:cell division protease FtsH
MADQIALTEYIKSATRLLSLAIASITAITLYQYLMNTDTMAFKLKTNKQIIKKQTSSYAEHWAGNLPQQATELLDILNYPDIYDKYSNDTPQGVLLVGPPGTGKTHFAKLMAEMNDSEFFSAAATQFDEIFVGRGPQRVRRLFQEARDYIQPTFTEKIRLALNLEVPKRKALIFIDEIDALGSRYNSLSQTSTHSTISQLLSELDGINERKDIIFVAATNHYKQLDEALKRSGRFSRIIEFHLPDKESRKDLIRYYVKCKNCDPMREEELEFLGSQTEGFSSADMKQLISDATMILARKQVDRVKNHTEEVSDNNEILTVHMIHEAVVALKKKKSYEKSIEVPSKVVIC